MALCRKLGMIRTTECQHAAVRHCGNLLQLEPRQTDSPTVFTPSSAECLPFPLLADSRSGAQLAPTSHLPEHFSRPGGAIDAGAHVQQAAVRCAATGVSSDAAAAEQAVQAATAKQSRGWDVKAPDTSSFLPEADLVRFTMSGLQQTIVLEALVCGYLLHKRETMVLTELPYSLTLRKQPTSL